MILSKTVDFLLLLPIVVVAMSYNVYKLSHLQNNYSMYSYSTCSCTQICICGTSIQVYGIVLQSSESVQGCQILSGVAILLLTNLA